MTKEPPPMQPAQPDDIPAVSPKECLLTLPLMTNRPPDPEEPSGSSTEDTGIDGRIKVIKDPVLWGEYASKNTINGVPVAPGSTGIDPIPGVDIADVFPISREPKIFCRQIVSDKDNPDDSAEFCRIKKHILLGVYDLAKETVQYNPSTGAFSILIEYHIKTHYLAEKYRDVVNIQDMLVKQQKDKGEGKNEKAGVTHR